MPIKYTEEQLNTINKSLLIQMFLNLQEEIVRANNQIELLTKEVQSFNERTQTMMEQLVLSNKARFGRSSEKMYDPAQISFMEVDGSSFLMLYQNVINLFLPRLRLMNIT